LDVLDRDLGISKISNLFPTVIFLKLLVIKHWGWIRIGIQPKMLDPDPESMNPDPKHGPQHCFYYWYLFIAAGDAGVFRAGTLHLHAKSRGEQLDKTKSTLLV
jgi:hypothetical protein